MELQYILFDLDGTLTNSEEGIIKCVRYALDKLGREIPGEEDLLKFIGPPLVDSFRDIMGMTKEEAAHATAVYRERYNVTPVCLRTKFMMEWRNCFVLCQRKDII